jgi:hypothetical protein
LPDCQRNGAHTYFICRHRCIPCQSFEYCASKTWPPPDPRTTRSIAQVS